MSGVIIKVSSKSDNNKMHLRACSKMLRRKWIAHIFETQELEIFRPEVADAHTVMTAFSKTNVSQTDHTANLFRVSDSIGFISDF